jgi:hypothetical protein
MIRSLILTMAGAGCFGVLAAPPASAQQFEEAAVHRPAPPASYSEAELRSVALAVVEVQRLNDAYLPRLQAATSSEEQQEVRQAASTEMKQAIEKHISIGRYTEIVKLARLDEDLAERIRRHMSLATAP